jgi:hypothetical protein
LCPAQVLQGGARIAGRLQQGDCSPSPGRYFDQFVLQVTRPGTLRVSVSSKWFDPDVALLDSGLKVLDESARPALAVLEHTVGPGVYVISVTSRDPSIGQYELQVQVP